jgi:hypothetical protein
VWFIVRTSPILFIQRAVCGTSSEKRTPVVAVWMVVNSPRMSSGASGFGSNVSSCDGAPER